MPHNFELSKLTDFIKSIRPREEIRDQLDIGAMYDIDGIKIFERRPFFQDAELIMYHPFAKLTYAKKTNTWHLYWKRASLKWDSYEPLPHSEDISELLEAVRRDDHGCFRG